MTGCVRDVLESNPEKARKIGQIHFAMSILSALVFLDSLMFCP